MHAGRRARGQRKLSSARGAGRPASGMLVMTMGGRARKAKQKLPQLFSVHFSIGVTRAGRCGEKRCTDDGDLFCCVRV
jgi:hypothetical protein